MKKFTLFFILIPVLSWSQTPTEISENLALWLDVPYLVNGNTSQQGQRFKFDKKIKVETNSNGRSSEMYLYLNTQNGNYAFMAGKPGTLGDGSFNYDDPGFMLNFFTQKGEMFQFYNQKKNGELKHYVGTGNTIIQPLNLASVSGTVRKKSQTQSTVNGFTAQAYSGDSGNHTIFMVGSSSKSQLQIRNFFGYSGIGYVKTDGGIHLVTDLNTDNSYITATSWENSSLELDVSIFTESSEGEFFQKAEETANRNIEKAQNKEISGPCSGLEMDIQSLKIENANKTKNAMTQASSGNWGQNTNARKGLYEMANIEGEMLVARKQNDLQICKLEHQNADGRFTDKINCLIEVRQTLDNAVNEITILKDQYTDDPDKMMAEQMRVMKEAGQASSGCR